MENKYVLSCINGYSPSQSVIEYGCWVAKLMSKKLKLFHTIDHQNHSNPADLSGSIGLGSREEMLQEMVALEHEQNKLLQKKAKLILETGSAYASRVRGEEVEACLRRGRLLDNLIDLKDQLAVTVIGKYGKNHQGKDFVDTSVGHRVEAIAKNIELPLLIVSQDFKEPTTILLAYDGSAGAKKVLEFLCTQFSGSQLKVELLYFGRQEVKNDEMLEQACIELIKAGYKTKRETLDADPRDSLPLYLNQRPDAILAMGAFGGGVIQKFFVGSLTSEMIRKSQNPILLVK